jgi:hypothetical protein
MSRNRLLFLLIRVFVLGCAGLVIYRQVRYDSQIVYVYSYVFSVIAIAGIATRLPVTRSLVVARGLQFRIVGITVAIAGATSMAIGVGIALGNKFPPDNYIIWLFLGPIFVGYMIAMLPTIIHMGREGGAFAWFRRRMR